jgi:hypothetical protein
VRRPGSGKRPDSGRKPLRRKPKTLTEDPTLYEPAAGGVGAGLVARGERKAGSASKRRPGSSVVTVTDDASELVDRLPPDATVDPEALRRARHIATLLSIPKPRPTKAASGGRGKLASIRFHGESDDIDLDGTLENLVEHPMPDDDDIVVREREHTHRSVVLVVDVSGSMRGERVRTAAATVGALYGELPRDDLAVIAFPLQTAAAQLARVPAREARVLLLSDCVHNAGPDPRGPAARLPRLDVLVDTSGEHDLELARDLARSGHGRLALARTYRDAGRAISRMFAT